MFDRENNSLILIANYYNMIRGIDISIFILLCFGLHGHCQNIDFPESKMNDILSPYKIDKLLHHDDFNKGLSKWVLEIEKAPNSRIYIKESKLIIDVLEGATAWFKIPLSGNYMISYKRLVRIGHGKNDRLSDLNQFWM